MSIIWGIGLGVLAVALLGIWGVAATANFMAGLAFSPVFGVASVGFDVIKAFCFLNAGVSWRKGKKAQAVVSLVVWLPLSAWSFYCCMSYASRVSLDVVESRAVHGRADSTLIKQIEDQLGQLTKLQDLKVKSPPASWPRIEEEIGRVEERIDRFRNNAKSVAAVGAANPLGAMLGRWIGADTLQLMWVVIFLLAVEIASNLGLWAFAPLFGRDPIKEADKVIEPGPVKTVRVRKKEPPKPIKPLSQRDQAVELVRELEARHGEGKQVPCTKVFEVYKQLHTERRWGNGLLPHGKLGIQLKAVGVSKDEDQGIDYYVLPTQREKAALLQ